MFACVCTHTPYLNILSHAEFRCHCNTYCNTYCNTQCNTQCNTHCNTLQHTATHCNTPQHTATHRNTLYLNIPSHARFRCRCDKLQHALQHTMQHTSTHFNTLQHTSTHFTWIFCRTRDFNIVKVLALLP